MGFFITTMRTKSYDEGKKSPGVFPQLEEFEPKWNFEAHLHICLGGTRLQYWVEGLEPLAEGDHSRVDQNHLKMN